MLSIAYCDQIGPNLPIHQIAILYLMNACSSFAYCCNSSNDVSFFKFQTDLIKQL